MSKPQGAYAPATRSFTISAGAVVRGRIRREIESAAWRNGLDVRTDESKGLLESVYRFTITGQSHDVTAFVSTAEQWMRRMSE